MVSLINALQSEGMLTLLAEPNLTTLSGETASFMAGGEVPIPVPQSFGVTTIDYKRYGVQLQFTPTLLAGNRITMRVQPEVSEISSANSVNVNGVAVPAFISRRVQSNVEMASGQTLAIAGLFQRNDQVNLSRFPWLSDIPVLGALFRSVSYQRNETELVILVTPYLSAPVGLASRIPPPQQPTGSGVSWVRGGLMRPILLAALLLSGCAAPVPAFVDGRGREVIPVAFIPGASVPVPSDAQRLLALRRSDGPALIFRPPGQLAAVRADAVARLSGRPVQIAPGSGALAAAGAADQGVLVLPDAADVALDPCLGPAGRGVGGLLPGSERNTQAMLPPGCATEQMLRAQAADPADLLRGRPLAPGTALPFAEAAEKYLQRNSTNATGGRSAGLTSGGPPPVDAPAPVFGRGQGAPSGAAEPPASPLLAPAPSAAPGRAAPTELLGPL